MIKLLQSGNFIEKIQADGLFYTKIRCIYDTYGFAKFTDYWHQENNALIARLDNSYIVWYNENADKCELKAFLSSVCSGSVLCAEGLLKCRDHGRVMKKELKNQVLQPCQPIYEDTIPKLYSLLKVCESENFSSPDKMSFTADMMYKLKKGTVKAAYIHDDNKIISMAIANIGGKGAVLTAVATAPEYRRQGFGSSTVNRLISSLPCDTVYLQRAEGENEEFYKALGFVDDGKWIGAALRLNEINPLRDF